MDTPEKSANVDERDGFAARLRQVMDTYGSTSALARTLGRSEGAVRKWLRGKSEPNVSDLRAICEITGTGVEWLVMGRGSRGGAFTIQNAPPPAPAVARPAFDYKLLDTIMATLDEEARAVALEVPRVKRSSMVGMLYEMFADKKEVDREAVARMVRLAQV